MILNPLLFALVVRVANPWAAVLAWPTWVATAGRRAELLNKHLDQLHILAKALLEYETLNGDEIKGLLRGEPIIREASSDDEEDHKPKSSVPASGGISDADSGEVPQGA